MCPGVIVRAHQGLISLADMEVGNVLLPCFVIFIFSHFSNVVFAGQILFQSPKMITVTIFHCGLLHVSLLLQLYMGLS